MVFHVLTLFRPFFEGPFACGIVARAQSTGRIEIRFHELRDFTSDRHRTVDDRPFGGDEGMVIKIEPVFLALEKIRTDWAEMKVENTRTVLLSAQGRLFDQAAQSLDAPDDASYRVQDAAHAVEVPVRPLHRALDLSQQRDGLLTHRVHGEPRRLEHPERVHEHEAEEEDEHGPERGQDDQRGLAAGESQERHPVPPWVRVGKAYRPTPGGSVVLRVLLERQARSRLDAGRGDCSR